MGEERQASLQDCIRANAEKSAPTLRKGAVWNGEGPPDDAVGDDGDVYVDRLSGAVCGKGGGAWASPAKAKK